MLTEQDPTLITPEFWSLFFWHRKETVDEQRQKRGVWAPKWGHWQSSCRNVCPQKVTLAKTVNTEHQQLLGVWVVTKSSSSRWPEGACPLGWDVLHGWAGAVQTHQNLRHCHSRVFALSTRLSCKLLKCGTVKCSLSLPAHWGRTACAAEGGLALANKEGNLWHSGARTSVGQSCTAILNSGIRTARSEQVQEE